MINMIFYLNLGPKYEYKYVAYEKSGETKWECEDQVADEYYRKEYAIEVCNYNPSCRYIHAKPIEKNSDGFSIEYLPCTTLRNSSKSSVLQKTGGPYENFGYKEHSVEGHTKWDCDNVTSFHARFDDAIKACDQNPSCNYIENEDCSGNSGYKTCSTLEKHTKDCAFEKTGK